jgi:glutathione peroxidase
LSTSASIQVSTAPENPVSAYDFAFSTPSGDRPLPLSDFAGKVILLVNTASECGFTRQFKGLEKLSATYKDRGLAVIGVPCNDFGGQEPGTATEAASFCQLNYGVTFTITGKEQVRGEGAHPFYQWARKELGRGTTPKWNFHKYLIGRDGRLVTYFASSTSPGAARVAAAIESALGRN